MNEKPLLYPPYDGIIVDSHCHLMKVLPYDENLIRRLNTYASRCILDVGISPEDWDERMSTFSHLGGLYFSIGAHPCMYDTLELSKAHAQIQKHASEASALGEMGLDWYRLYAEPKLQYEFFEMQLSLAQEYNKPAIIHARSGKRNAYSQHGDAVASVLEIVKAMQYTEGGIMHCFSGTYEQAQECIERGFYISFAANVSYASAHELQKVAQRIPLEHLLVETDAPYLLHKKTHAMQHTYFTHTVTEPLHQTTNDTNENETNIKKRRHNHPSYLPFSYESIAMLRAISIETLVHTLLETMQNMLKI